MAEEKKSIEISYKANIKDLVSKLEQIPNVTKQEAKKMVAALDRQLKQAEKAAKQSATASKKAAQEMAKGAKRGARDFDQLADSAQHAGKRMEMVAEKSGDIDRGFSGVGMALSSVNPQLGEAANGMADTFAVVESLIMGFGGLNPIVLAGAVAVGALAMGYMAYVEEKAGEAANESFVSNINNSKQVIEARKLELKTIRALIGAQKIGAKAVVLSDDEKERLRLLQLQTNSVSNMVDLTDHTITTRLALVKLEDAVEARLAKQEQELAAMDAHRGRRSSRANGAI